MKHTMMSPRCTPIGAATSLSARALATASLATILAILKENYEFETFKIMLYLVNPERALRILPDY